jgi:hypothetical protein
MAGRPRRAGTGRSLGLRTELTEERCIFSPAASRKSPCAAVQAIARSKTTNSLIRSSRTCHIDDLPIQRHILFNGFDRLFGRGGN